MVALTLLAVFGVAALTYLQFGARGLERRDDPLPPPPPVDTAPGWPVFEVPSTEGELVRRLLHGALSRDGYRSEMEDLARADAERHPVVVPPDRGVEP